MTNNLINQSNYTSYQPSFLLDFNFSFQKDVAVSDLSISVLEIIRRINLHAFIDFKNLDTRAYDPVSLLTIVVLAFSERGYTSLRELEDLCRYDLRYRIICNGQIPSYKTFQRFINERLKMSIPEIAKEIYLFIQEEEALQNDILYVDGTKFEANANKMSFCWRGWSTRYLPRHWQKSMELLRQANLYFKKEEINVRYSILREPSIEYMIEVDTALTQWLNHNHCIIRGRGKHEIAKIRDELRKKALKLWEYALQEDILGERNSFSKTDPDATFMHMKYDYYNHTGVFKPGYNVQVAVNNGYIALAYISAHANDVKTLQPLVTNYKKTYGHYPKTVVGDAGYGSFENYVFCKYNHIDGILKYSGYEKKKERINDKNRYRLSHLPRLEDGTPVCPQGYAFTVEKMVVNHSHSIPKMSIHYRNENCQGCSVRQLCTKAKDGRSAQINPILHKMHEEIDTFLKTEDGITLMKNRSAQAEGAFADIKKNFEYTRLRRRGESGVEVELGLITIGYNIRRYHNRKVREMENSPKEVQILH